MKKFITNTKKGEKHMNTYYESELAFRNGYEAGVKDSMTEIERLKEELEINKLKKERYRQLFQKALGDEKLYDNAKAEAIIEFAERLKKEMQDYQHSWIDKHTYYLISFKLIDTLLEEMLGKSDA